MVEMSRTTFSVSHISFVICKIASVELKISDLEYWIIGGFGVECK